MATEEEEDFIAPRNGENDIGINGDACKEQVRPPESFVAAYEIQSSFTACLFSVLAHHILYCMHGGVGVPSLFIFMS